MATNDTPSGRRMDTRLSATLFSGDRLYPVTVVAISEEGFAAEGVSLDGLDEEFLLEMTLPPVGEPSWSPKAAPAAVRSGPSPRVRARARLDSLVPTDAGSLVAGLSGRFHSMPDGCRSALRSWLTRLAGFGRSRDTTPLPHARR